MASVGRVESPGSDPTYLWEQRRSWLCFGWHQPFLTPRWTDHKGQSLVAAEGRPKTTEYRRTFKEKEGSRQDWEWCIVVNEQTDDAGWSYGGCGFWELFEHRMSLRSRPGTCDLVKRRKWVHRSQAASLRKTGQMGSIKIMDPIQIVEKQKAVQKELQEAKAAIWDLIDELDKSVHIKDMYMALLDPVALNRVSTAHMKAMMSLQQSVLKLPAVTLQPEEVWKETADLKGLERKSVISDCGPADQQSDSGGILNLAQRFVSRTRGLVKFTQMRTAQMAKEAGDIVTSTGRTVKSVITKIVPGSHGNAPPDSDQVTEPDPRGRRMAGPVPVAVHADADQTASVALPDAISTPNVQLSISPSRDAAAVSQARSPGDEERQRSASGQHSTSTSTAAAAIESHSVVPEEPGTVHAAGHTPISQEVTSATHESNGAESPTRHLQQVKAGPVGHSPAMAGSKPKAAHYESPHAAAARSAPTSPPHPAATPCHSTLPDEGHHKSHLLRKFLPFLQKDPADYAPNDAATDLALSLPELRCAYLHACAVYGDLEQYVDGAPAQTFAKAITKFTGVADEDVVYAVWRSEVFKPGHCLTIDRGVEKIIISIRGTYENADVMSDLVARPVMRKFTEGLEGVVHVGILKSSDYVLQSVWSALQTALLLAPDYPILVTGHSMGGGAAGLVALMLRHDTRLPPEVRCKVRAVCLAPAAVMERDLSVACQSFIASVILGNDVVPRIGLHTFSKFVQEVALASPFQRAKRRVKRTWRRISLPFRRARRARKARKARKQRAVGARGSGPRQPAAAGPPAEQPPHAAAAAGAEGKAEEQPGLPAEQPPRAPVAAAEGRAQEQPSVPKEPMRRNSKVQTSILGQLFPPGILLWVIPNEIVEPDGLVGKKPTDAGVASPPLPVDAAGADLVVSPLSSPISTPRPDATSAPEEPETLSAILVSELDKDDTKPGLFSCACMAPRDDVVKISKSSKEWSYEIRQVGLDVFDHILFFHKALTDHLPLEYLKGIRMLVLQQELSVHRVGEHNPNELRNSGVGFLQRTGTFFKRFSHQSKPIEHLHSMPVSKARELRVKQIQMRSSRW